MGTTYKGIYIPDAGEDNWDVSVNANWTRVADRDELVRKSANEPIAVTALQNDDHLVYTMTANHTWAFKLVVLASSTAGTTGFTSDFTVPASASWSYIVSQSAASPVVRVSGGAGPFVASAALPTSAIPFVYEGVVTCGATAGNFQFQWAPTAAATVTVVTNSYLLMKLLV